MIVSIYIFFVFKIAPKVIDSRSNVFWRHAVKLLNSRRKKTGEAFYLWKAGRLYIRDPYEYPMKSHWTSSSRHPFCWYIV